MILGSKLQSHHAYMIGIWSLELITTLEGGQYELFGSTKLPRKSAKSKGNRFGIGYNAPSDGRA